MSDILFMTYQVIATQSIATVDIGNFLHYNQVNTRSTQPLQYPSL